MTQWIDRVNGLSQAQNRRKYGKTSSFSLPTKQTSMGSLIIWNISKALEKNPCMDLRHAMRSAHESLGRKTRDDAMTSQPPEERHLTCALLAWHQLGHKDADSLYQFIEQNRTKPVNSASENYSNKENIDSVMNSVSETSKNVMSNEASVFSKDIDVLNFHTKALMGPVVKLPMETQIVMRLENTIRHDCSRHSGKKLPKTQTDIMSKIDAACCMDKMCVQRLTELDTAVTELRNRAAKLARREAERVALLERAESAWKDLELGYQRRLNLAVEKEEDLAKQIQKTIEERNNYKSACTIMADSLKERSGFAEEERERLVAADAALCERACERARYAEQAARGDAELAHQFCAASQLDRDLLFKEDQARRKVSALESEVESIQCLTHEAERSLRYELGSLKEQIAQVANQLIGEESIGTTVKIEVEELRNEKHNILEDLNGCKAMCDNNMQWKIDELKKKREQLIELKDKVIECKCKVPIDAAVEVKRTPSLAALCNCAPEDKFLDSCSCTSLRSQLLSNLLSELFSGLQSELGGSGSLMPCQLLKCLEDKHNWDRSSTVKTNLKSFFEQLLVGELDIAIATSIEKYHAKWVGASCADALRVIPDPGEVDGSWHDRAIERRAQKLAVQLAEQMFKERTEEITKRAKDIVTKGPPPCKCETQPAVYPCLVKTPITSHSARKTTEPTPPYLKRTLQDVTQLRIQIEDLKKEVIKKEDLRLMEEKITRIVKASKPNNFASANKKIKNNIENGEKSIIKDNVDFFDSAKTREAIFKKKIQSTAKPKASQTFYDQLGSIAKRNGKLFKKIEQSFAVNVCLCSTQDKIAHNLILKKRKKSVSQNNTKRSIIKSLSSFKSSNNLKCNDDTVAKACESKCICFNKIPSNTSIDKLLETLVQWKNDLHNIKNDENINKPEDTKLNANASHTLRREHSVRETVKQRKNTVLDYVTGSKYSENALDYYSTKDEYDKGTDCANVNVPMTTDSEYIGQINLDKSYDNCLKFTAMDKLKSGDGKNVKSKTSFTCVSKNLDHCKKTESNLDSEKYSTIKSRVDLKKVSQVYSLGLQDPQYKCVDTNKQNLDQKESKQSFVNIDDTFVSDVLKRSDLLSRNCDYCIKLLGVTLTHPDVVNDTKDINNKTKRIPFHISEDESRKINNAKLPKIVTGSQSNSKLNMINFKLAPNKLGVPREKSEINNKPNNEDDQDQCVCCDKNETEDSNDLELNVFNLLEEYLKGKLAKFQSSSCKSQCISAEEERTLYSSILGKVKEIISENTTKVSCQCIGLDEESWKRAYGLLKEYLKIKINRVQCSCISNNNNVNDVIPVIMDKLTNVIENDFHRLREKCKCKNKNNNSKHVISDWKEQTTETVLNCNDMSVQFIESNNIKQLVEDTSIQVLSTPMDNKSCGVILSEINSNNTAEKKVSCQFRKGYITDCTCCQATKLLPYYYGENIIVNHCVEPNLINNEEEKINKWDKTMTPSANFISPITLPRNHSSSSIQDNLLLSKVISQSRHRIKYPYIGYTLSCCDCKKSLTEANTQKIDAMIKAYTDKSNSNDVSYIMPKFPTKVRSEFISYKNDNCLQLEQDSTKSFCDVEIVTSENEEEFVLKMKSEYLDINSSKNCSSDTTEYYKDASTKMVGVVDNNNYDTVSLNKKNLFDSLYLPTNKKLITPNTNDDVDIPKLRCDCKQVPICHVKMLISDIEKKLVASKCTCDSLSPQLCPVHFGEKFF